MSKSVFTEKRKNIDLLALAEIKVIFKVLVKEKRFSLQPSFLLLYYLKNEINGNRNKSRTNNMPIFFFFQFLIMRILKTEK